MEALVADVYAAADTLGQYLNRAEALAAEQGRPLTAPQRQAADLVRVSLALAAALDPRGSAEPRSRG